jgi:hypothetical protein
VGERNRGAFVLFLFGQAAAASLCLRVVGTSSIGFSTLLFESRLPHEPATWEVLRVVAAKLYLLPVAASALVMAAAHAVLVSTNVTTFECARQGHLEYLRDSNGHVLSDLPFSRGLRKNLEFAFRPAVGSIVAAVLGGGGADRPPWAPVIWEPPSRAREADDESPDWWNHLWRNKYWSCC